MTAHKKNIPMAVTHVTSSVLIFFPYVTLFAVSDELHANVYFSVFPRSFSCIFFNINPSFFSISAWQYVPEML